MRAVILDGYTTNPGDLEWGDAFEGIDLTVYDRTPADKVEERCAGCEIVITNKVPLGKELISKLPELKFIALLSTGFNVVDVEYCREKGIPVSNVPTYSTNAVAQLTFALIMEFTNKVSLHNASVKKGDWTNCSDFCYQIGTLTELNGKTLGIVGYGKIGRTVAKIAAAYGMNVLACTAHPEKNPNETDVKITALDEVKKNSDFITLHCPLTPKTEKLVNEDFINGLKPGAILINTSRGPVLDEDAVAKALTDGRLAGCAVDVLSTEPPKADNPLLRCDNCVITPHVAWAGFETRKRLIGVLNDNIRAYLNGKPENVVNGL